MTKKFNVIEFNNMLKLKIYIYVSNKAKIIFYNFVFNKRKFKRSKI